ncbi:flagellar motor protein MotB [Paucibacter aquatile]|uniref:Flagellar motor protein MotB n=1 Tax=Kinneretia aquatilis TaxID=2070761 RepID=A0A2N8KV96_9BURK|nr:flagellar motor protein MotB [Paucibacter aquatile]PND37376.1 flagellar motor protein MotB [Paucibacter aquatile]
MLGMQAVARRRARDEGEKPFWISFSDLMSALMVLFLVTMSVALLAVTKKVSDAEREERERTEAIEKLMGEVQAVVNRKEFEGVRIVGNTIDFGPRGKFEREGQNTLSPPQREVIRNFTPTLLAKLRSTDAGRLWFKRAVVEGYASQTGSYLFNLNLSLERSQRVLCELLRESPTMTDSLSEQDRKLIATKFFVGGASFNSLRADDEASRRIEFKLEFKTRQERKDEEKNPPPTVDDARLTRALSVNNQCQIQDRLGR